MWQELYDSSRWMFEYGLEGHIDSLSHLSLYEVLVCLNLFLVISELSPPIFKGLEDYLLIIHPYI